MKIVKSFIKLLRKNNLTLSTCESITGGKLASYLTSYNGSSKYFLGSIVSYSTYSKLNILQINKKLINNFGTVSSEISLEMAKKVQKLFNSSISVSYTGNSSKNIIENKPKGLTYVTFIFKEKIFLKKIFLKYSKYYTRNIVIKKTIKISIKWILLIIKKENLLNNL